MDIKTQLVAEFDERLEALGTMKLGSEEYKAAVDSMMKLADRIIEIEKIESEGKTKDKQMRDGKMDKIAQYGFEVIKLGAWGLLVWGSFNFEKYGTLTTPGGKKAIDKMFSIVKI